MLPNSEPRCCYYRSAINDVVEVECCCRSSEFLRYYCVFVEDEFVGIEKNNLLLIIVNRDEIGCFSFEFELLDAEGIEGFRYE